MIESRRVSLFGFVGEFFGLHDSDHHDDDTILNIAAPEHRLFFSQHIFQSNLQKIFPSNQTGPSADGVADETNWAKCDLVVLPSSSDREPSTLSENDNPNNPITRSIRCPDRN